MTNRFERLRAGLAAPFRGSSFSPGRRLVLAGAALAATGLGWLGWRRASGAYTLEASITALCDRLLPASGAHPGAVALGVHQTLIGELRARGENDEYVTTILAALREAEFLSLPADGQDAALGQLLDRRDDPGTARLFRGLLRRVMREYLAHPGSWPALAYRKPQPLGYPDYASCREDRTA